MNVKNIEKKENNQVAVVVEVEAKEFEVALNEAYRKNKKDIYIPGFRKGKAPRTVIEGMYGKEVFYQDALELVYPSAYDMAAIQDGMEFVGQGAIIDVDIADDKTVAITFQFDLYPEVKLGQFKGLEAVKKAEEVTDEEVEADLNARRERNARMITVDRAAEMGDIVTISYEGFKDGVAFEGGKADSYDLALGSNSFIPGFEEGVVGMAAGDEKDIELTFPTEYHAADLAGAAVVFKVKAEAVKVKELPELDDEFVKDISEELSTVEELKADIRTKIQGAKDAQAESKFREELMSKAIANMEVTIPDSMIEETVDRMMQQMEAQMQQYGMTAESYAQMMGMDLAGMRGMMKPQAEQQVKTDVLCRAIYETGEIEVTEDEIEEEYKRLAEQYEIEVEKVKEIFPADMIKRDMGMLKATDLIFSTGVAVAE